MNPGAVAATVRKSICGWLRPRAVAIDVTMKTRRVTVVLAGVLVVGCGGDTESEPPPEAPPTQLEFGGDRPVTLNVPPDYDHAAGAPLLILLHGYTASGTVQDLYWGLTDHALARGFLYVFPDGTVDEGGSRFWNATDGCCDFGQTMVDDSGYLRGLVDEISSVYNVDSKRIYFTGHSNGSFMSFRMACDHADIVAGIAGLAGAMWQDGSQCPASEPVHVLHIHGDMDDVIPFAGGGSAGATYPGASASVEFWANRANCSATAVQGDSIDIDAGIDGAETTVSQYNSGCDPGGSGELWTIQGGGHLPAIGPDWMPTMLDWLLAHPKP